VSFSTLVPTPQDALEAHLNYLQESGRETASAASAGRAAGTLLIGIRQQALSRALASTCAGAHGRTPDARGLQLAMSCSKPASCLCARR